MENQLKVMPFDENFQLAIFELLLTDKYFAEKCYYHLKPEYFKNEHFAFIFLKLKELFEKEKSLPTKNQLKNEILQIREPNKYKIYEMIYKRIIEPVLIRDYEYVRKNLAKFVQRGIFFQINEMVLKSQQSEPEKTLSEIERLTELASSVSFDSVKTENLSNIENILERSRIEANNLVPTYLPTIDNAMSGGVPKGTLTIGLSGTNVGKSIWLVNWAYHLIINDRKVFYVNLESYLNQPLLRIISRAIKAPYNKVRWNDLTHFQKEECTKFQNSYGKNFEFYHNASFDFNVEDLIPILRKVKQDFNPDVIMIDYGQILKSKRKFEGLRHEQAYIHRALASMAGELDVAMVTVAQGNRDTNVKNSSASSLIRMTDISECFEICRAAATVLTLNRSEKDEEMERAKILLDKQRDGKKNVVEFCKTNFQNMCFFGHESEGLGFITTQQYLQESNQEKL